MMKPAVPPKFNHLTLLSDPCDGDEFPLLSLPTAVPNVASQQRILSISPPTPENNHTTLRTTPNISLQLHTKHPTIRRFGAMADPDLEVEMPLLQLPDSQACVRKRFTRMLHGMMYPSGRPRSTTPPLQNDSYIVFTLQLSGVSSSSTIYEEVKTEQDPPK